METSNAVTVQFIHAVIISVLTIVLLVGLLLWWLVGTNAVPQSPTTIAVPTHLQQQFLDTDWRVARPEIESVELGGPLRDMIPTLDEPTFVPISTITTDTKYEVAVLVTLADITKAYPLYILRWHGVVHDTIADTPIAVTYSPLSDRVMVYERVLPSGEQVTFGVSGSLLDEDMVMFDRAQEALWWQRSGKVLAGRDLDTKLQSVSFLRKDLVSIQAQYGEVLVLSDINEFEYDYHSNPYAQ